MVQNWFKICPKPIQNLVLVSPTIYLKITLQGVRWILAKQKWFTSNQEVKPENLKLAFFKNTMELSKVSTPKIASKNPNPSQRITNLPITFAKRKANAVSQFSGPILLVLVSLFVTFLKIRQTFDFTIFSVALFSCCGFSAFKKSEPLILRQKYQSTSRYSFTFRNSNAQMISLAILSID